MSEVIYTHCPIDQLKGQALDWAVGIAMSLPMYLHRGDLYRHFVDDRDACPCWSPAKGGAMTLTIMEQEGIELVLAAFPANGKWVAKKEGLYAFGDTQVEAAMRCFVASKLQGPIITVPEILFDMDRTFIGWLPAHGEPS